MDIKTLDQKAQEVAGRYKRCERELLEVIIDLDSKKAFYRFGYNSLFSYITGRLGLSSSVAYNFIGVARKSREVPELKKEILTGKISISKARKMVSVITPDNQAQWIKTARTNSQKQLEKAVVLSDPESVKTERVQYIASHKEVSEKISITRTQARMQLKLGVSEDLMLKLRRAQDLESQRSKKAMGLEKTLDQVLDIYLAKMDPIKKAQRQKARGRLLIDNKSLKTTVKTKPVATTKLPKKTQSIKAIEQSKPLKVQTKIESSKPSKPKNELFSEQFPTRARQKRTPIPKVTQHQVQLRDQGCCTFKDPKGRICTSQRFIEIHHILPISKGGGHELENLQLLCAGHHKAVHLKT